MAASPLPRLLIWGAGGHAGVVFDAVVRTATFSVPAMLVDPEYATDKEFRRGVPVMAPPDPIRWLREQPDGQVFVAFGENASRHSRVAKLLASGFVVPAIVHPSAMVAAGVELGPGVFVGPGAIVNSGAVLHQGAIVNSGAIVEHDCIVEAGAHVAPGAVLGGHVAVGQEALVGLGATICPRIQVQARATVGAGSVVTEDVSEGCCVAGVPARAQSGSR